MTKQINPKNIENVIKQFKAIYREAGYCKADCLGILQSCDEINLDWEGFHICDWNPWISSIGGTYLYSKWLENKTPQIDDEIRIHKVNLGDSMLIHDLGFGNMEECQSECGNLWGYSCYGNYGEGIHCYLPLQRVLSYLHGLRFQ